MHIFVNLVGSHRWSTSGRGDWKWIKEALRLAQHFNTDLCCHLCRAHKNIRRNIYTDVSEEAGYRRLLVDPVQWWVLFSAAALASPLLFIPGFNIYKWSCREIMWQSTAQGWHGRMQGLGSHTAPVLRKSNLHASPSRNWSLTGRSAALANGTLTGIWSEIWKVRNVEFV